MREGCKEFKDRLSYLTEPKIWEDKAETYEKLNNNII